MYNTTFGTSRMKRIITTLLHALLTVQAMAATYYVDVNATSGENGLSPSTAFNTLAQVNRLLLKPGDSVLLNRGDIFREILIINNSGNASAPIYYGAYGTGNAPIISGATTVTGWTNSASSVYTASCPSCPSALTQVFVNERLHIPARYPNRGYFSMSTVSSSGFTSASLTQAANAWDSAFVYAKTEHWVIDQFTVKNYTPGQITINTPNHFYASYPFQQYFGFFLTGKPICLDTLGEWYFDSTSKTISIIPLDAASLQTSGAQVSVQSNCIQLNNVQYVTIENLQLEKSLSDAILIQGTQYVNINNCTFIQSGRDGIGGFQNYGTTNSNLTVSGCSFTDMNNTGINLGSGSGILIKNNIVKRCGVVPGMGSGADMGYEGIYCPSNATITGNVVDSVGYCAIHVNSNDTVTYNLCSHYGLTKDDCGGVYFWSATGNYVANNITANGYGNGQGTVFPDRFMVNGIYSDDQSNGNTIINNTSYRNQTGIVIHNTNNTLVSGNVLYDNWGTQIFINEGNPHFANVMVHNNKISKNIFQCLDPSQRALILTTEKNNQGSVGTLDSNYYCNPYTDKVIGLSYTPGYYNGNSTMRYDALTLSEWQSRYGYEANGHTAFDYPTTYAAYTKLGADQITNSTFNSSIGGWWTYGNTNFTIQQDNSNLAMNGGSLKGQYTADTTLQVGNWGTSPLSIQQGKAYLLSYSIEGASSGGMQVLLNESNAPYTSATIPFSPTASYTASRAEDTLLYYGNLNTSVSLVFNSTNADGTFWMDNVDFYEVLADTTASAPHKTSILFTNPSFAPLTIPAAGNYRDLSGALLAQDVTLAPFGSVVLKNKNTLFATGITKPNSANTFYVYPNPVSSSFKFTGITYTGPLSISISDQMGREVYSKTGFNYEPVNMPANLMQGLYFVKVSSPQSTQTVKIVYIGL